MWRIQARALFFTALFWFCVSNQRMTAIHTNAFVHIAFLFESTPLHHVVPARLYLFRADRFALQIVAASVEAFDRRHIRYRLWWRAGDLVTCNWHLVPGLYRWSSSHRCQSTAPINRITALRQAALHPKPRRTPRESRVVSLGLSTATNRRSLHFYLTLLRHMVSRWSCGRFTVLHLTTQLPRHVEVCCLTTQLNLWRRCSRYFCTVLICLFFDFIGSKVLKLQLRHCWLRFVCDDLS